MTIDGLMDVLVQFHATAGEIAAFVEQVVEQPAVCITVFRFPPFSAAAAARADIGGLVRDGGINGLAMTLYEPIRSVKSSYEFLIKNPNAMRVDIGRLTGGALKESGLSARTTDPVAHETWKRMAQSLRNMTKAGAIAVNPDTGATSKLRQHRYTVGAKRLDDEGVVIRPVAGGTVLHFGLQSANEP